MFKSLQMILKFLKEATRLTKNGLVMSAEYLEVASEEMRKLNSKLEEHNERLRGHNEELREEAFFRDIRYEVKRWEISLNYCQTRTAHIKNMQLLLKKLRPILAFFNELAEIGISKPDLREYLKEGFVVMEQSMYGGNNAFKDKLKSELKQFGIHEPIELHLALVKWCETMPDKHLNSLAKQILTDVPLDKFSSKSEMILNNLRAR